MAVNGLGNLMLENKMYNVNRNKNEGNVFGSKLQKVEQKKIESLLKECQVKKLSADESDNVKVDIFGGRVLKAKVLADGKTVYIEEKTDEGEVNAYEVDSTQIDKSGKDIVTQLIVETMEKFEYQLKRGEPKYSIGGSEFSIKEWDKLISRIDNTIEETKEELELREEKLKQEKLEEKIMADKSVKKGDASDFIADRTGKTKKAPYSYLADENGIIEYNSVMFQCDNEKQAITLGDVSDKSKVINITLSNGGSLIVNRDNLDDLAKAIGMFSPEDINLIMRAIAQDAKIRQMQKEIDDTVEGLGENEKNELEEFVENVYLNSGYEGIKGSDIKHIGSTDSLEQVIENIIQMVNETQKNEVKNTIGDLNAYYMESLFEGVDEVIKNAWKKTSQQMKINGYDMSSEYTKYVTQLQLEELHRDNELQENTKFGESPERAMEFVEKSIESLNAYISTVKDENKKQAAVTELEFYNRLKENIEL